MIVTYGPLVLLGSSEVMPYLSGKSNGNLHLITNILKTVIEIFKKNKNGTLRS